jgi:hypothetical protein
MMGRAVTVVVKYDVDEQTLVGRTADGTYVKFAAPAGDERADVSVGDVITVYLSEMTKIPDQFVEVRQQVSALL